MERLPLSRRAALLGVAAASALTLGRLPGSMPRPAPARGATTPKKGVGAWAFGGVAEAIVESGASWYFNWSPTPVPAVEGAEFVPLVFDAADATPEKLAEAGRHGRHLMGFNEPDLAIQANMSVDEALSVWPALEATGLVLGSPATSAPADTSPWLEAFMRGAAERGQRVDFMCVHWYGARFDIDTAVTELAAHLVRVHARWGLPIWLSEWALIDWSDSERPVAAGPEVQGEFALASVAMLEALPIVERYAWFCLPPWQDAPGVSLAHDSGAATSAGRAYARAGG